MSGGGTGGHIYPAIAIANALKLRYPKSEFLFVGAKDRMEMTKVPMAGYKIKGLWISGIQRKLSFKNILFPIKLIVSLFRSKFILGKFKPDVVIGTGGFASAPLLKMASRKKIPCLIQEQNSYAGITNKWLAKDVNTICVAYDGMQRFFPKEKIVNAGNPVRESLLNVHKKRTEALSYFGLKANVKTLLVLGGSLGSKRINELIDSHLDLFRSLNIQLIWQTGANYFEIYKNHNALEEGVGVYDFLSEMDLAYAAADIIISRAGAISVSELSLVGKPVIFIPSPNVAEDHQKKNALAIAENSACILIEEQNLEGHFKDEFLNLIQSETLQEALSENLRALGKAQATESIVNEIEKLLS